MSRSETESQKVEAQVAAMEARLAMMKVALTAEKEKTSGAVQQDGSRWRSGGVNAGSLSRYDKDINRRGGRRKKRGDSATRGPSSSSSKFVSKNFSNRSRGDRRAGGPKSMSGQKTPRGGRENAEEWSQAEVVFARILLLSSRSSVLVGMRRTFNRRQCG